MTRHKSLKRSGFKKYPQGRLRRVKGLGGAYKGSQAHSRFRLPSIKNLKKKLWELCKQLTRLKYGNICYTCGYKPLAGSNWQTGHFIASSICSTELRYDLKNLRPQCMNCNFWKSGEWPTYEANLIKNHGADYVAELKRRNLATRGLKYDVLWFQAKIDEYQKLLSDLSPAPVAS